MGTENNKSRTANPSKKRKQYLPHNKAVKKKGAYPLHPGVEGFFVTCDGGRERQASHEAINVIDSFYEELVNGIEPKVGQTEIPRKPLNKVIKFTYSDSSSSEDEDDVQTNGDKDKPSTTTSDDGDKENSTKEVQENEEKNENHEKQEVKGVEPPAKKQQCVKNEASKAVSTKLEEKSIDKLIEEELADLGDRGKRRFSALDSGCNGVVFVQMRKKEGDPGPIDIVQHMMTSLASTRKHVSRFLLRVLPIEVACYASEEEIKRAIKPIISRFFPEETENPAKFAVLYDARANTGIDRKKIIDAVAKCVPPPHKVDLSNADVHIVVQIVRTICLIGVVRKYKELAKYNVRELTASKQ